MIFQAETAPSGSEREFERCRRHNSYPLSGASSKLPQTATSIHVTNGEFVRTYITGLPSLDHFRPAVARTAVRLAASWSGTSLRD